MEQYRREQAYLMDEIEHHRQDVERFAYYLPEAEMTVQGLQASNQELVDRCEEERRQTALMQREYDRYRREASKISANQRNVIEVLT